MKKQYIQPSMKAYKVISNIICGSGNDNEGVNGGSVGDDKAPSQSSGWGFTGIFGE